MHYALSRYIYICIMSKYDKGHKCAIADGQEGVAKIYENNLWILFVYDIYTKLLFVKWKMLYKHLNEDKMIPNTVPILKLS